MFSFNFGYSYMNMSGFGTNCMPFSYCCPSPAMNLLAMNSLFSSMFNNPSTQMNFPQYQTQDPYADLISELNGGSSNYSYANYTSGFGSQQHQSFSPVSYPFMTPPTIPTFTNNTATFLNITNTSRKSSLTPRTKKSVRLSGELGNDIVSTAKSYIGYKESDNSYKIFTKGKNHAWCADFVTHVVKETYKENGKKVPSGFGSSSVEGLRQWGTQNNCYFDITGTSNKASAISSNIKSGDIVIFKSNGASHTGIVANVNSDGSFSTVEGNTSDKVANRNYNANDAKISGFVQIA